MIRHLSGIFYAKNVSDSMSFSFAADSIEFQCRYARTVTSESTAVVPTAQPQPIIGTGELGYDMEVQLGGLGGNTRVNITANHNFDSITPK